MLVPEGNPSFTRFSFEALACADMHSARLTHAVPTDLERRVAFIVQTCHETAGTMSAVDPHGNVVWVASTVALPLEWRASLPDCTVVYTVKECPTRYGILRVHVGDAGAVYAAYSVIAAFS